MIKRAFTSLDFISLINEGEKFKVEDDFLAERLIDKTRWLEFFSLFFNLQGKLVYNSLVLMTCIIYYEIDSEKEGLKASSKFKTLVKDSLLLLNSIISLLNSKHILNNT